MKKIVFLLFVLLAASSAFAQTSTQGQFTFTVAGFVPLGTGSSACQPGPGPTFPACALPAPSLGSAYTATLATIGLKAPLTVTVSSGSLPSGWTVTTSGTNVVISGTPSTAGVQAAFTLAVSGS